MGFTGVTDRLLTKPLKLRINGDLKQHLKGGNVDPTKQPLRIWIRSRTIAHKFISLLQNALCYYIKFQVFSDFILSKQPSTVKEALEIYREITKNFGTLSNKHEFATPMYVKLTPLKFVSRICVLTINALSILLSPSPSLSQSHP